MSNIAAEWSEARAAWRARIGPVGIRTTALGRVSVRDAKEAVAEYEALGFGALWIPDAPEIFSLAALVLSSTEKLVVCSSIASIYTRDASAAENGAALLGQAFDDRFIMGLGVSHRKIVEGKGLDYERPLPAMRGYLDKMDAAAQGPFHPAAPAPRLVAALAPLMLRLSAERSLGAHPYFTPVEHTAMARDLLGQEPMLCVELSFALAGDRRQARDAGSRYFETHLGLEAYRQNLVRAGIAEEDLASDETFDRIVAWGGVDDVAERVRQHLEAGADHVCVQALPTENLKLDEIREVAATLATLTAKA